MTKIYGYVESEAHVTHVSQWSVMTAHIRAWIPPVQATVKYALNLVNNSAAKWQRSANHQLWANFRGKTENSNVKRQENSAAMRWVVCHDGTWHIKHNALVHRPLIERLPGKQTTGQGMRAQWHLTLITRVRVPLSQQLLYLVIYFFIPLSFTFTPARSIKPHCDCQLTYHNIGHLRLYCACPCQLPSAE